jgi:hypothetical protein
VTVLHLEAYLRCTLPLAESLAVAEHVEACDSCSHLVALKVERGPRD